MLDNQQLADWIRFTVSAKQVFSEGTVKLIILHYLIMLQIMLLSVFIWDGTRFEFM